MARKKQEKAIYTINQKVTIQGLGECIITDIHDDDGIRLEVYKAKDEDRRFKNRYIVPESDVVCLNIKADGAGSPLVVVYTPIGTGAALPNPEDILSTLTTEEPE